MGFVISAQRIRIGEKKIEAIRNWLELQSVRDIQVFLGFTNFYKRFIKNFSRITVPLTLIFRTINDKALGIQATKNKGNKATAASGGSGDNGRVG